MALPPSVRQRSHKLSSMCRSQRMRLSPERQDLNTAGRCAFPPSRPGEPAGFSAPGCLVYFYKRCLSSKCRLSCNFGSSIRLCVCLPLSWGGKRLRPLTTSTGRGPSCLYSFSSGWYTRATHIVSDVVRTPPLFARYLKERSWWSLLFHLHLCFEGRNPEFQSNNIQWSSSLWHVEHESSAVPSEALITTVITVATGKTNNKN